MSFVTEWKHRRALARQAGDARKARREAKLFGFLGRHSNLWHLMVLIIASVVAFIAQLGIDNHHIMVHLGFLSTLRMVVALICGAIIIGEICYLSIEVFKMHPIVGILLAIVILSLISGMINGNFFG